MPPNKKASQLALNLGKCQSPHTSTISTKFDTSTTHEACNEHESTSSASLPNRPVTYGLKITVMAIIANYWKAEWINASEE
jgi:hypothetical protein